MLSHGTLVRLGLARERLRDDVQPAPSIAAIAHDAGWSTFQFIRLFAAVFGTTPHQCRIDARLERARHLLARGDLSVTEVCLDVGFSSLGSFSAQFARRVGDSPSVYRRRVFALPRRANAVPHALVPSCLLLMGGLAGLELAISEKTRRRAFVSSDAHTPTE